ncbi:MAG: isoleucine--tRNA ligase [Pseudomonadota bacterium]
MTKRDYKETINLPKTAFPMKASLAQREPEQLKQWQQDDIYQKIRQHKKAAQKFILHDGPPYANGNIHLGHAENKILKDIIVKAKNLSGFDAPYVPGWDCHGLPIEHKIEKKFGKAGAKIDAKTFRQKCREYAAKQMQIQSQEFQRLGIFGDWQNPYMTMDPLFEANVIRAFAKMIENGHLVRGQKPVHWCLDCASALAEAEVEYQDKASPAIDVGFEVIEQEVLLEKFSCEDKNITTPIQVVIWTTTPWTLPANQAVCLHRDLDYVLLKCQEKYLVLAADLIVSCTQRYGCDDYTELAKVKGEQLEGILLQHPFYDRQVPITLGEHVTLETGTGCVHTAPAHGLDDYFIGQQYDLPLDNPVDQKGCFNADVALFANLHVFKANQAIIDELKAKQHLIHEQSITHSYPHCWRHKTPLIFRATPQWFFSMEQADLRDNALNALEGITFIPESGKKRLTTMIANRPDWCISRQRTWGVPLALFIDKQTGECHPDTVALLYQVAERVEQHGVEAWYDLKQEDFIKTDTEKYQKSLDILDVWFDSGVTHYCVLEQNPQLQKPAEVYLEGSDQHRGWFQSSLLTAMGMHEAAPFKTLLTHGFIVDAQGHKMSKSVGNVASPEKIMKTLGADIIRLWVAASDYRGEVSVSDEIFKRTSDSYRRLRNTARYLLANLNDYDPEAHVVPVEAMLALDKYIVAKAYRLQQQIKDHYDAYQFLQVQQIIHHFCAMDLGAFYLDVIKDRQYTTKTDSLARRSAQTAMYHVLHALVRWIAPILSFTAEEIWRYIPGEKAGSVFMTEWYDGLFDIADQTTLAIPAWEKIIQVRDAVNKVLEAHRNAGDIGAPLDAEVKLFCQDELAETLAQLEDELKFVFITSSAIVVKQPPPTQAEASDIEGLWLQVIRSKYKKCIRCWHHRADVGANTAHPEICLRCVENVDGDGEQRQFA